MPSVQPGWPSDTGSGGDSGSTNLTVNAETGGGGRTLALSDANTVLELEGGTAWTVTIPANASVAFPVGTIINIVQAGSGTITVQADTGVTLNGVSVGSADIDGQWTGVSLYKSATDEWVMQGSMTAVAAPAGFSALSGA